MDLRLTPRQSKCHAKRPSSRADASKANLVRSREMTNDPKTLITEGQQARKEGRLLDAKAAFTQAVQLSRDHAAESPRKEAPPLAQALSCLARVERTLREISASLRHYQEAAKLYRERNQPLMLAHTIRHVADILRENGDLTPAAASDYEEALRIYRDHPETEPLDLANTLRGYALFKSATGHPQAAIAFWQEARNLYADVNVQAGVDEAEKQIAALSARE